MKQIKLPRKFSLRNQQIENYIINKYGRYTIDARKIFVIWFNIYHPLYNGSGYAQI
jgi:hypothetical protein